MTPPPSTAGHAAPPVPHAFSGVVACPAQLTYYELVEAALRAGWSADGLQAEEPDATVGQLLERRQPRPILWSCGLLPERCVRLVASRPGGAGYTSIAAPRKASGPDWAYLFAGGAGEHGHVVEASFGLARPAERYLLADAAFDTAEALFEAARAVAWIAPFSTRRLDWRERRLAAAVPARVGLAAALRERLTRLGCALEAVTGVPDELRFLTPVEHDGPALVVSAAYDVVARTVRALAEDTEGSEPLVVLRYPDTHGVEAFVGLSPGEHARLDTVWPTLLDAGPEVHDARRRGDDGDWEWLAPHFELGR